MRIIRALLFIIVVVISSFLIAALIGVLIMLCQRIHFVIGLVLFVILWKILLPLVTLVYKQVAKISPFPMLTIVIAFLFIGGECLLGIIGIIRFTINSGISFSSVLSAIVVIAMSITLFKYSIAGFMMQARESNNFSYKN
jgi:hypothetical protein